MNDFEQCTELYSKTFNDEDNIFRNRLFELFFDECRYLKVNDKVVSQLFALPCSLIIAGQKYKARYIYAVSTDIQFRNMGFMRKLIEELKKETDTVLLLKPSDSSLINFYARLGFEAFSTAGSRDKNDYAIISDKYKELLKYCNENIDSYVAMYYYKKKLCMENLSFPYTME